MVNIKSVEEYEDEEYHEYGDDEDDEGTGDSGVFEATTFHPNSVLPADAMDKVSSAEETYHPSIIMFYPTFLFIIETGPSDHQDDDGLWELQEEADAEDSRSPEAIG